MKTKLFFICVFLVLISFVFAQTQDKQYVVKATTVYGQVPTIDGVVSTGEWSGATSPGCKDFVRHNDLTTAATEDPEVKAIFNEQYLFILYQVINNDFVLSFDPSAGDPDGDHRDPTNATYNTTGDDFEFFFYPNGPMSTASQAFYHIVFFPYQGNNICYITDTAASVRGYPSASSWNATDDQAAFSYNSGTKLFTLEYKISWTSFTISGGEMTTYPASGTEWGIQIGFYNNSPAEICNWEPDETAGFLNAEPYGKWTFTGTPPLPTPTPTPLPVLGANTMWTIYE
jgi:hypothetical protein